MDLTADLEAIRKAFCNGTYDFTDHGAAKMLKLGLRDEELVVAICEDSPEVIEDYPADERGPACLVLGWIDLARPLHIEVGYGNEPSDWMAVCTVYVPDEDRWHNYRKRTGR